MSGTDTNKEFGGGVRYQPNLSRFSAIRNGTEPISYHGSSNLCPTDRSVAQQDDDTELPKVY